MDGLQQDIVTDVDSDQIHPQVYDLYDQYCHSDMDRREFLKRAAALSVVGAVSGLAMAQALLPRYAEAQTVSFTDSRIKATYVTYDSPGGNSGKMRGYLVHPAGAGPFPAVLVVHENRGLNPHIEDVARRAALDGFIALAPDALYPLGGYPGNDDDGKVMQKKLDRGKISVDMLNGAKWLKGHSLSNGKLAATGFCFGGGVINYLAVKMGSDLSAGAPYYGKVAKTEDVPSIKAAMQVHFAEDDKRINKGRDGYAAALKANNVTHEVHTYPGTRHGFHNNSTKRYNEEHAKLAWSRTMAWFKKHTA